MDLGDIYSLNNKFKTDFLSKEFNSLKGYRSIGVALGRWEGGP
jgi:hypothetical protein